jgi:site-specific DNA-methyltransferase (adenine-specific)
MCGFFYGKNMADYLNKCHFGDCLDVLRTMPDNSVDAIVTDPPYGLSFMGKKWDYDVPAVEVWAECLRVLKPGGHLLSFAGTRTQHRMAVRIEDAGFEIRDMIAWVYGSGFPKSHDVSKAIDREAGAERLDAMTGGHRGIASDDVQTDRYKAVKDAIGRGVGCGTASRGTPVTEAANQWQGWGTALKPSLEPITVARKPFSQTVAENVLEHGTGAMNIDGCRVAGETPVFSHKGQSAENCYSDGLHGSARTGEVSTIGRWPANLIHDGSAEVLSGFPQSKSGAMKSSTARAAQDEPGSVCYGTYGGQVAKADIQPTEGSAARFFYCAKASSADREKGNNHPTVKPTDLMRYLVRLVTPPGGIVLDPFMGSGSTGCAAVLEGFQFVGIEREAEYHQIASARIASARRQGVQPSFDFAEAA